MQSALGGLLTTKEKRIMATVINATTGQTILENVTDAQFDRWYDHHADYRQVRGDSEVHPNWRGRYRERARRGVAATEHWLVQD